MAQKQLVPLNMNSNKITSLANGTAASDGAAFGQIPVKAIGSELDTLTNDTKFLTAKAVQDNKNVPHAAPSTSGNLLQSNGTDWASVADPHATNTVLAPTGGIQMYAAKAAPTGWLLADGSAVSRSTYAALYAVLCPSGSVTFDITTEIATKNGHGFVAGDAVFLTTSGTLPTGLTANTMYYVIYIDINTFYLATTFANANIGATQKILLSGANGSGHTLTFCPYGLGDGSTTFNVPNFAGRVPVGINPSPAESEFDTLGVSAAVGEKAHTNLSTESGVPAHTHPNTYGNPAGGDGSAIQYASTAATSASGVFTKANTAANAASAHNNIQPYLVVTYIIKT